MLDDYYTLFALQMQRRLDSFTSSDAYGIGISEAPDADSRKEEPGMTEESHHKSEEAGVELFCDGQAVPLNPFVKRFIGETIRGMVRSLEGVSENPGTIEIRLKKK